MIEQETQKTEQQEVFIVEEAGDGSYYCERNNNYFHLLF